jgi:hypothetical protein
MHKCREFYPIGDFVTVLLVTVKPEKEKQGNKAIKQGVL